MKLLLHLVITFTNSIVLMSFWDWNYSRPAGLSEDFKVKQCVYLGQLAENRYSKCIFGGITCLWYIEMI